MKKLFKSLIVAVVLLFSIPVYSVDIPKPLKMTPILNAKCSQFAVISGEKYSKYTQMHVDKAMAGGMDKIAVVYHEGIAEGIIATLAHQEGVTLPVMAERFYDKYCVTQEI